jgi:hypothetical protein
LNFFTGFYDKGVLIMHLQTICRSYITGYMWIDIVSSIPISFIGAQSMFSSASSPTALQSAKFLRMIRLTRYLRLLRLIRFIQVSKLMSAFELVIVSEQTHLMFKFFKISVVVVFVAHWIACLWYSVT